MKRSKDVFASAFLIGICALLMFVILYLGVKSVGEAARSRTVAERDICIFRGSTTLQQCFSNVGESCKGVRDCRAIVRAPKKSTVTWRSTCGGEAYTYMDGMSDYAVFNCRPGIYGIA